jgi:crotonyl-CoA carboxylase/reductase
LIATTGANAIGVISDDDKRDFVMQLGAKGVINRKNFKCWGQMPQVGTPEYNDWMKQAREFGKAIWNITGKGNNVDMVFEHPGRVDLPGLGPHGQARRHGGDLRRHHGLSISPWMRVICGCTRSASQGSHFANLMQASAANKLVRPSVSTPACRRSMAGATFRKAHMKMWKNEHRPGNMAVLVSAPRTGLKSFEDTLEAAG